jgi:heme/copper-type cytochrome/quinol oxidase subunit 2
MQIRTLAAILAWIVVALLLLNGMIKSQELTIAAIVLTVIAVIVYFIPRFQKRNDTENDGHDLSKTVLNNIDNSN